MVVYILFVHYSYYLNFKLAIFLIGPHLIILFTWVYWRVAYGGVYIADVMWFAKYCCANKPYILITFYSSRVSVVINNANQVRSRHG